MKAIKDYSKLPKFLQVTHSPNPYKLGEIVKVQPLEFQKPDHKYDHTTPRVPPMTDEFWQKRYCRVWRKDSYGKFINSCVLEWRALDYLKKK